MLPAVAPDAPAFRRMVDLRRTLHAYPELAFEEVQTAGVIMRELDRLRIDYDYGGKGGAVVGRLTGTSKKSPVVALRAEMDGLPAQENTGLPFASRIDGHMHACGHDVHMAMVLGAAAMHVDSPPPGDVVYVFQPAEERGGGARVVLESGVLSDVSAIFAGHVTHHHRVGEIMVVPGTVTAQSDGFSIRVTGKGGHGARPHEAIDAVVITSLLIIAIQALVTREVDPVHPAVVTIGRVEAGTASNVIAEDAILEGTIRTTRADVRENLHRGIERLGRAFADLHRAEIDVEIRGGYPPVINTPTEAAFATEAVRRMDPRASLVLQEHPSMGSEDFGFYLQSFPGCYVRFGARPDDHVYVPLHSPQFDVDERVLGVGASWLSEVARVAMGEYS